MTILAPSFHGATTLAALLNNHPDIVSLGDTNPPRVFEHHLCTCGAEIRACPFWVGLKAAMQPFEHADTPAWFPTRPRIFGGASRLDSYLTIAAAILDAGGAMQATLGHTAPFQRFRTYLDGLAKHVLAVSGKPIFVDGEKSLTKFLAGRLAGFRPARVIHLLRDPRAFVASSKRIGVPVEKAARDWRVYHQRIMRLTEMDPETPMLRLHYEALTADPKGTMAKVFAFIGVADADVFYRPGAGDFWHQTGNRTILEFDGSVRSSERWRSEIDDEMGKRVLALAGPLSAQFGYAANVALRSRAA